MALPVAVGMAAIGGLAGMQKDRVSTTSSVNLAPASQLENMSTNTITDMLRQLGQGVNAGPGITDINNAQGANNQLASMLKNFANGGFLPSESDFATANKFATSAFQPQAVALQQQFQGQQQRTAQLAAQMGRPVNDPILQAKLSQEYMQGQERLGAAQGAFSSQFALSLPQQRLGYTSQLADVQNSLASQAMANRQALLSLGSQVQGAERNFRLATASRTNSQESGGGLKGAMTGALAGAGAGMGIMNMMGQQDLMASQANFFNQGANYMPAFAAGAMKPNAPMALAAPQATKGTPASLSATAPTNNFPQFAQQLPTYLPQLNIMQNVGNPNYTPYNPPTPSPSFNYQTGSWDNPAVNPTPQYNGYMTGNW